MPTIIATPTASTPPSAGDPFHSLPQDSTITTIGRKSGQHLRIVSVNALDLYVVVAVYAGDLLHSSCYLRADNRNGYHVQHAVRHRTQAPILDVHSIVRRLLSAKRFNTLVGMRSSTGPVDVLRCGVAIGSCTFFIREFVDGEFVAVVDDGDRQTQSRASADDWNALIDAWDAEGATYGDARRVRIAERFFRSRGWMPAGFQIFRNAATGEY
jgi:hypothetical protein